MKNKISIMALALLFAISISSCDFVNIPKQAGTTNDTTSTAVIRKVFIEDYTGHHCTNCPLAAAEANTLIALYGSKIVVMGVHAGFFADTALSGTQYRTNFRTPAGDIYDGTTVFNISQGYGNPNGMINRENYPTAYVIGYTDWPTNVAAELAKPATAKLTITNTYNSATRSLNCSVNSTFLYDTLTGPAYKLVVAVIQDSIISDQLNSGTYVTNYVHRHVLRDNINGPWGDNLVTGSIVANAVINKSYTYTFPVNYPATGGPSSTSCDINQCYIVAYIYNNGTKEVIQVEEAKVN